MEKIDRLTEEQEKKIPLYVEEALKKGLSTERLSFEDTQKWIHWLYSTFLSEYAKPFVFLVESPLQAVFASVILSNFFKNLTSDDLKIGSQSHSQLGSQLSSQLSSKLYSQLNSPIDAQLGSQLNAQLDAQLHSQFNCKISFRYWWLGYYTFYKFIHTELLSNNTISHLKEMESFCHNIPMAYVYDGFCVVSQPPVVIHRKGTQLHKENGQSVSFSDGWGVCSLNGIRMPEKYVLSDVKTISVSDAMKEQNVDVRREVLRKIGLERFVKETNGKCIDKLLVEVNNKKCEYQLFNIDLGKGVTARVLKMDNPSIDAMHIEGVEDTCNTVKEALAWRNGFDKYIEPKQLT